jgi:hypothetical protein
LEDPFLEEQQQRHLLAINTTSGSINRGSNTTNDGNTILQE